MCSALACVSFLLLAATFARCAAAIEVAARLRTATRTRNPPQRVTNGLAHLVPFVGVAAARIGEGHGRDQPLGVVDAQQPAVILRAGPRRRRVFTGAFAAPRGNEAAV